MVYNLRWSSPFRLFQRRFLLFLFCCCCCFLTGNGRCFLHYFNAVLTDNLRLFQCYSASNGCCCWDCSSACLADGGCCQWDCFSVCSTDNGCCLWECSIACLSDSHGLISSSQPAGELIQTSDCKRIRCRILIINLLNEFGKVLSRCILSVSTFGIGIRLKKN